METMRMRLLPLVALVTACAGNQTVNGVERVGLPAGVRADERVDAYSITGSDRASVTRGIRAGPPEVGGVRRFAGYHEWRMNYRYETRSEGSSSCRISAAYITITSVVTLPEWNPPAGTDADLVNDWTNYRNALATHEEGHRQLIYSGAGRIQQALLAIPPQSCPLLADAARSVFQPLLDQLRAADARYDSETRHGATQGAVWASR